MHQEPPTATHVHRGKKKKLGVAHYILIFLFCSQHCCKYQLKEQSNAQFIKKPPRISYCSLAAGTPQPEFPVSLFTKDSFLEDVTLGQGNEWLSVER